MSNSTQNGGRFAGRKTLTAAGLTTFVGTILQIDAVQAYIPPDTHAAILAGFGLLFGYLRLKTVGPVQ